MMNQECFITCSALPVSCVERNSLFCIVLVYSCCSHIVIQQQLGKLSLKGVELFSVGHTFLFDSDSGER